MPATTFPMAAPASVTNMPIESSVFIKNRLRIACWVSAGAFQCSADTHDLTWHPVDFVNLIHADLDSHIATVQPDLLVNDPTQYPGNDPPHITEAHIWLTIQINMRHKIIWSITKMIAINGWPFWTYLFWLTYRLYHQQNGVIRQMASKRNNGTEPVVTLFWWPIANCSPPGRCDQGINKIKDTITKRKPIASRSGLWLMPVILSGRWTWKIQWAIFHFLLQYLFKVENIPFYKR